MINKNTCKRKILLDEKGFTLIEIIASLVILGILGTMVVITSIKVVEGFLFVRINCETAQKGHLALNRLTKEFTNIISVDTANTDATSITFTSRSYVNGAVGTYTVSWGGVAGNPLLLDNDPGVAVSFDDLVDNVNGFAMAYLDTFNGTETTTWSAAREIIKVTLTLDAANGVISTFTTHVVPRNL